MHVWEEEKLFRFCCWKCRPFSQIWALGLRTAIIILLALEVERRRDSFERGGWNRNRGNPEHRRRFRRSVLPRRTEAGAGQREEEPSLLAMSKPNALVWGYWRDSLQRQECFHPRGLAVRSRCSGSDATETGAIPHGNHYEPLWLFHPSKSDQHP